MASSRKPRNVNKRFSKVVEELQEKDGSNPSKKTKKRKLSDMLGSQWGRDELERFYEAFRKNGRDWRKIAAAVRNRPPEMVEALYNMNKAYLSLPEGHATATGLIAMMTDHYNILEGSDSEQESNDASKITRKTPKRGRGKFRLMPKGSDGSFPDLMQYQASSSSFGCLSLLKWKRSGGCRPRAVGKRTPRVPVPFFLKEDKNGVVSSSKHGLKSESHAMDDEGVHVAALALAEASQRGGSPQISRTPDRRRYLRNSPVPSCENKIGNSKFINGQVDDDNLEDSLGSREAENGEFVKEPSISGTQQKLKKVQGKRPRKVDNEPFDDDREACSGTEEGVIVKKLKDGTEVDLTGGRVLRSYKGSKKRNQQLFFGDGSSALDALQTLADLSLNILLPASTVESESSIQIKEDIQTADIDEKPNIPESLSTNLHCERPKAVESKGIFATDDGVARKGANKLSKRLPHDSKAFSDLKQQNGSLNTKIQKRKTKSILEKNSKSHFESDSQKNEFLKTEGGIEEGKRYFGKVKRVCPISIQQKQGKYAKLQEHYSTPSDLGRVIDPNKAAIDIPSQNEVKSPTKYRNRRKMNLLKVIAGKESKVSENDFEEHPARSPFSNRSYGLKETLSHCLSSPLLRRWCQFEWFYSAIDYPWFAKSEFVEYLNHVRLGHIPRLTRVEWGVIRSSLGKPRRLSDRFLQQEREKLELYRESVRSHYSELRAGLREGLPTDLARPLSVGQRVIACHPKTREVHDGSILTVDRNRCRVQFDRPELGVEFVMDIDCMPSNPVENIPEVLRGQNLGINKFCNGFSDYKLDEQNEFKTKDNMTFTSTESLVAADGASHFASYSYPMNTLMNQAKGDTLDAIVQAKAAVNEVAVAAQQAMYSQPFTLAQIQAREADIRALADLSRTLDKKEALLLELRQMNEEVSTKQKNGDHITDLETFRKQYATVLLQLKDANDQVASALLFLRQRNTYERNSTLTWNKSNETSVQLGSTFSPSARFTNDSRSNVLEVVQCSRQKAKTMVNVAVQAMHALKDGEDAFVRIGEALDLANKQNAGSTSAIAAVRNNFSDATPCNRPYQDYGSINLDAGTVQASSQKFQCLTNGADVHCPSELISSCVATLFMIQMCTEKQYPPAEVAQILDSAVLNLQPCCPQNLPIFREIETCMGIIKNQMLALVPTPTTMSASDATPLL